MEFNAKEVIQAAGALGELCSVFYKSCVAQGFTTDQAFELTKEYLITILENGSKQSPESGDPHA